MFKLTLKGFEPLLDLEIESDTGIFIITGDDGLGIDKFINAIRIIGRLLTGRKIGDLYGGLMPWKASPERLEFSLTHTTFHYHVILVRKSGDYRVELEEIKDGKKTVFKHTGTTCNLKHKVESCALEWKAVQNSEEKFPLLEQMQIRPWDDKHFSDFIWVAEPAFCQETARENMKSKLFKSGTEHWKDIDNYLHWLSDDYSGLEHYIDSVSGADSYTVYEHATQKKVYWNSTRLLGILNLLYNLLDGAKVIWHPESVINNQKVNAFYEILNQVTPERPMFIVTNNTEFHRAYPIIYFKTCKEGIECTTRKR